MSDRLVDEYREREIRGMGAEVALDRICAEWLGTRLRPFSAHKGAAMELIIYCPKTLTITERGGEVHVEIYEAADATGGTHPHAIARAVALMAKRGRFEPRTDV